MTEYTKEQLDERNAALRKKDAAWEGLERAGLFPKGTNAYFKHLGQKLKRLEESPDPKVEQPPQKKED